MKLLIISNMAHYRRDGVIVGHGATAREIDALSSLFESVRHIGCLHDEDAPASALPYEAKNVELVPVPPAGGAHLADKLDILRRAPLYARTIVRELPHADVVHVRGPANISFYALGILALRRHPSRRWIKYAGNWRPTGNEPLSYRLQRQWLETGQLRANVTVNGSWPGQPPHVHTFANPCLTDEELAVGEASARTKTFEDRARLLFVGHLGAAKNPRLAIDTAVALLERGHRVRLDLVGEGKEREEIEAEVRHRGFAADIALHGPLPRNELDRLYARADFIVLPSRTEGWPKVLAEGMAFGAIPIASAVGSIPETLTACGTGFTTSTMTPAAFADGIERYLVDPTRRRLEVERAVAAARRFSYRAYLDAVRTMLDL